MAGLREKSHGVGDLCVVTEPRARGEGRGAAVVSAVTRDALASDQERRHLVAEVRRRLAPGAPFVVAHLSVPQGPNDRERWLSRYGAFAIASGVEPDEAAAAREGMGPLRMTPWVDPPSRTRSIPIHPRDPPDLRIAWLC